MSVWRCAQLKGCAVVADVGLSLKCGEGQAIVGAQAGPVLVRLSGAGQVWSIAGGMGLVPALGAQRWAALAVEVALQVAVLPASVVALLVVVVLLLLLVVVLLP